MPVVIFAIITFTSIVLMCKVIRDFVQGKANDQKSLSYALAIFLSYIIILMIFLIKYRINNHAHTLQR